MVLRTITAINDTITSEESPSTPYSRRPTLTMRSTSNARTFGYLSARSLRPDDRAQVNSAILQLTASESAPSSTHTIRRVLGAWNASDLTWSDQPTGPGPQIAAKTTALVADQPVDFDVKDEVARWVTSGARNFGFRLENSTTARSGRSFHSVNAAGTKARFRPVLIVDISYPPERPSSIVPGDGSTISTASPVVTWRYAGVDVAPMLAYQVQTNDNNVWSTPATDTGEVLSGVPQHQLTGVSASGKWFRIRHKSTENRWSDWSEGQRVVYAAPTSVTITSTEATTDDPTPATTWTVTGGTQRAFQVRILRGSRVVADSGTVVSAVNQWTPPSALSVASTTDLFREVRVWDDREREATVGVPVHALATSGPFRIVPATSTPGVTNLVASVDGPAVELSWSRSSTPDAFIVERRVRRDETQPWGEWVRVARPEPGEVAQGGQAYRWRDITARPEHDSGYRVRAVVNRSMGVASDEVVVRFRVNFIWLADPDDREWRLAMAGQDEGTWTLPEDSALIEVRGSDRVNVVHEGYRGYQGEVSGRFVSGVASMGELSAQGQRDKVWDIKRKPTHVWRLIASDLNIPVVLREVNVVPQPGSELTFGVSAEFYQQGELMWAEGV